MSKRQQNVIASLLIVFLISAIGLTVLIGFYLIKKPISGLPSTIMKETVIVPQTVIVPETVMVEVTPTYTLMPSPTQTTFPQSKDRIVFLSVWERDYYIINADGTDLARITNDGKEEFCPQWNPDGKRISYFIRSSNQGYFDVYVMDVNGGNRQFLFSAKLDLEYGQVPHWSPDGTKLAFSAYDESLENSHIYIYDGTNVTRLTDRPTMERFTVWSPDGSKIAYVSYHLERPLYVAASIDGYEHWLLSNLTASGFSPPTWSPDGKRLSYISGADIFVADFNDPLNVDRRTALSAGGESYIPSWSPDGKTIAFYYQPASCCSAEVNFMSSASMGQGVESTNQLWAYQESPITWSPDGSHIAVVGDTNIDNWNIYVVDIYGNQQRITDSDRRDHCPVWSP